MAGGADLHPREAVQHLCQAVLRETGGRLADDATAMCVDWLGGGSGARSTDSGADADTLPHPRVVDSLEQTDAGLREELDAALPDTVDEL